MILILLYIFYLFNVINSLNCTVSQIHISQGINSSYMTISWLTVDNCSSQVVYGIDENLLDKISYGNVDSYEFYYNKYYKSGYIHHVELKNLIPSTKYYYKCGNFNNETNVSSILLSFNTLPKPGDFKSLKFGIIGDIGQTINSVTTINNLMRENTNMILHTGDLSYADCEQDLWDSYGNMIQPLASKTPWMVCPGNHEIEFNGTDYNNLFTAFEKRYRMPYFRPAIFGDIIIKSSINPITGKPYCTPSIFQMEYNFGNSFFSFDTGLAHIIYLNPYTNSSPRSEQYNWLNNDLKLVDRSITPWVIVIMHCPWYTSNVNHYADLQTILMRDSMEELFYKYNVNIAFNGHVHNYERTYPVFKNLTDIQGSVYITIGNSGNLEGLNNDYYEEPKWSAFRNGTYYGYGILNIINNKMLLWKWYINDGFQIVFRDQMLLCNSIYGTSKCN
jgi:hypothetical protein